MWFLRLIFALVVTMTVPVAGFVMSDHITAEINAGLAASGFPPFEVICASPEADSNVEMRLFCVELASLPLLHKLSMAAGAFGAAIPATLILMSLLIGTNRSLLASIFPAIVQLALFMTVISVLMQGAVLTLGSLVAQAYFLDGIRLYITIGIGLGALAAAWKLFDGILDFGGKLRSRVDGMRVSNEKAPELHAFVNGLADRLDAQAPDNIIVGLEPTFFVTNAEILTSDSTRPLEGQTLYMSAPLARLMTQAEFAAVIGHELAHFRGADTVYSLKFAPVYAGLAAMLDRTSFDEGERLHHGLAKLPARAMLSFMMNMFAMNERAISRRRELIADQAGAEVASPRALATALIKVGLYAEVWDHVAAENIDRLNRGKATRNLSSLLESRVRYDIDHADVAKIIKKVAKRSIPHPTDTHPPVGRRLKALGVDPASIGEAALQVAERSAIGLFGNAVALEENLSVMEHKRIMDMGFVPAGPKGSGGARRQMSTIYRVAVPMMAGNGRIRPEAMQIAETAGEELFPEFDSTDFRQACDYAEEIPELEVMAEELNESLDLDQKKAIINWLARIAGAAGEIGLGEAMYIDAFATEIGFASE